MSLKLLKQSVDIIEEDLKEKNVKKGNKYSFLKSTFCKHWQVICSFSQTQK